MAHIRRGGSNYYHLHSQMAWLFVISLWVLYVQQLTSAANVPINPKSVEDWIVTDITGTNTSKPMFLKNASVIANDEVSDWPVQTYYWQAPEPYYHWKIYTYGGDIKFYVYHEVTRGDTSGKYLDEPDLVLEGGPREHFHKIGFRLPKTEDVLAGYDKNQTIKMPLTEQNWYYLVEQEDENGVKRLKLDADRPVSRADFSLVLAGLNRSLIRAKYHIDQVEGRLLDVNMQLMNNRSRTIECDNDCSGVLLDDLDDIDLLFDEIRRLAPLLKDGPWRRLAYLNATTNGLAERLREYLSLIEYAKQVLDNYNSNFSLETLADVLELRSNNLETRAPGIAFEAYKARLLAEKTLEELLKGLWDRINRILLMLNGLGYGVGGVSPSKIELIVQESEIILRELRNRNLKLSLDEAERELRKAKMLLEKIRTLLIDPDKSAELLKRLEQLNKVLIDFTLIVQEQVLKPANKANELVADGKKKYQAILNLLKQSDERAKESEAALEEARKMLEITKKCLQDQAAYLDQLPRQLMELNNSIHEIEVRRSILTSVNPEYQRKYVDKCREHGEALIKKSQELDGLFNATRDVADYAMRAANVYKNIAEAIDKAEKAARRALDAADKAYKVAVPDFDESLADKARESKRKSLELLEKAKKLRDQEVQRLSLELARRRQIVDEMFKNMKQLAGDLDDINAGLKQLADKNFMEQLQEIDAFLRRLLERIAELQKRLQLLSDLIYNSILPQYERLSAGSQSSLGNLSQVIDSARKDLQTAIKYASSGRMSLDKLLKLEAKLDLDLDLLRRKIQLAHQEASSVHISLMPNLDGICTRSYFIPAIMSSTSSGISIGGFNLMEVSLIWSYHNQDETESLLLFVGAKGSSDEFLALEMYDRRIRLIYNLNSYSPSGIQMITHPRVLEANDKGLLNDDAWFLISVAVVNEDQIRLSVRPVGKANERDTQQVSQRITSNGSGASSRLKSSPFGEAEINFFVGGLPPASDFSAPSQIKSSRLAGCLYNLALNEHQVGLWNFKMSQGCEGCTEGPMEARDPSSFSFSGANSYSSVSQSKNYDRTKYMVSMSVKTSEPDGLLFLALSETSNHYLSVFLTKGRVAYLIGKLSPTHVNYLGLSSSSSLFEAMNAHLQPSNQQQQPRPLEHSILTSREYNLNQWVKITAEKDQNRLVLAVEDEFRESIVDDKLLTLDMDQVFFGGVWPMIRPRRFANSSLEFTSFAGCMKDIQIETSPIDLLRRQSHGVEIGCSSSHATRLGALSKLTKVLYPLPAGRRR